jgi:hypothetical protein
MSSGLARKSSAPEVFSSAILSSSIRPEMQMILISAMVGSARISSQTA